MDLFPRAGRLLAGIWFSDLGGSQDFPGEKTRTKDIKDMGKTEEAQQVIPWDTGLRQGVYRLRWTNFSLTQLVLNLEAEDESQAWEFAFMPCLYFRVVPGQLVITSWLSSHLTREEASGSFFEFINSRLIQSLSRVALFSIEEARHFVLSCSQSPEVHGMLDIVAHRYVVSPDLEHDL